MHTLKYVNLVIASGSEPVHKYLCKLFAGYGADIILCGFMNNELVDKIESNGSIDVILIIIDNTFAEDGTALERLLDKTDTAVLFYEHLFNKESSKESDSVKGCGFSKLEINKLVIKIQALTKKRTKKRSSEQDVQHKITEIKPAVPIDLLQKKVRDVDLHNKMIHVWILGASLGGPEAVKLFLTKIPAGLPVAFVLAQHLGEGFVSLFADQLDKVSPFRVKKGVDGDTLHHGEVIVVPVEQQLRIDKSGKIKLLDKKWPGLYRPSIDCIIESVTRTFKKKSAVIIFSGMGSDGVIACQEFFNQYSGTIWVQSKDSCVISSMPDSIRDAGLVSYSATPELLAEKITEKYAVADGK